MPAHCNASIKHTKADIRRETPNGSNPQSCSLSEDLVVLGGAGAWNESATRSIAINPIATDGQYLSKDPLG